MSIKRGWCCALCKPFFWLTGGMKKSKIYNENVGKIILQVGVHICRKD
jgi:hypothetical protein